MSERAIDPFDVAALEKSLNDSAGRVSALWISYLIFGLYLVVAAGTVTHRQLFLEDPVKLPVLNIDLPLLGFFFVAPFLFVIFHAYMLLQVLLLGRTAAAYNDAMEHRTELAAPADNARVRQRLANTLFVQIFAGSPRERTGWLGILLKAMAWITLAIAPVLVLLVFQFKFLPYHNHLVTWTHRALILVDLAMIFLLWPLALDPSRDIEWSRVVRNRYALGSFVLFVLLSLSLFTFPGEPHVNLAALRPLDAVQCERRFVLNSHYDRLRLSRIDVVDDQKLEKIENATSKRKLKPHEGERTQDLSGRDLNCSDLSHSDLRRTNLAGASIRGGYMRRAHLQGAYLVGTQLQGVSLDQAKLQDALLLRTELQGARLSRVELQGAFISEAKFQGASLDHAKLQGAIIDAELQGASLDDADLSGASLDNADLSGASLEKATLIGASLTFARLNGASFAGAVLYGADLRWSELTHAVFSGASVWRARISECDGSRVTNPRFSAAYNTSDAINKLVDESLTEILDHNRKRSAAKRIIAGLIADPAKDDTAAIERAWRKCEKASVRVTQADFEKKRVAYLRNLVCDSTEGRDAIAKGTARHLFVYTMSAARDRSEFIIQLARGLLGEDGEPCAATEDLDGRHKRLLRAAITNAHARAASVSKPDAKAKRKSAPAVSAPAPPSEASTE